MSPALESVNHLNDNHCKSMTPDRTQAPTPKINFWKRFLQPSSTLLCDQIRKSVDHLPRLLPIGKRSLLPLTAVALSSLLETKPANAVGIIDPGVISFEMSSISSTVPFEGTVGWSFIVYEPRIVSLLGVYDAGADGLAVATEVGLWEREMFGTNGYLLASATVPAGTSGTLFGQFRYASIPELTLQPGVEYTLGALYNQPYTSDRYQGYANIDYGANSDPKFASWIQQYSINFSYQCAWSSTLCSKDLVFPYYVANFGPGGYYGPNIAGVLDTVPEVPGPMPILGVIASFSFSRKLRRRTRALT
jgi:hypothetical protein